MSFLKFGCLWEGVRPITPAPTKCEANAIYKRNPTRIRVEEGAEGLVSQIFLMLLLLWGKCRVGMMLLKGQLNLQYDQIQTYHGLYRLQQLKSSINYVLHAQVQSVLNDL